VEHVSARNETGFRRYNLNVQQMLDGIIEALEMALRRWLVGQREWGGDKCAGKSR